ncbi:unnamed protein product [Parascedosporium putredinis]|uniref:Uncharacterized protein n=1 Tax=Parascedosporium putredinis TaxID=1442378 RepID=A0A9P1GWR5_9PEZI|nr:unnamed protein product [Parascedosporium putredinis]CAI7988993.1 unnamed protein product [Parascedosporium putredinis]
MEQNESPSYYTSPPPSFRGMVLIGKHLLDRFAAAATELELRMTVEMDALQVVHHDRNIDAIQANLDSRNATAERNERDICDMLGSLADRFEALAKASTDCRTKLYCECRLPLRESEKPGCGGIDYDVCDMALHKSLEERVIFRPEATGKTVRQRLSAFFQSYIKTDPKSLGELRHLWSEMKRDLFFRHQLAQEYVKLKEKAKEKASIGYHSKNSSARPGPIRRTTTGLKN